MQNRCTDSVLQRKQQNVLITITNLQTGKIYYSRDTLLLFTSIILIRLPPSKNASPSCCGDLTPGSNICSTLNHTTTLMPVSDIIRSRFKRICTPREVTNSPGIIKHNERRCSLAVYYKLRLAKVTEFPLPSLLTSCNPIRKCLRTTKWYSKPKHYSFNQTATSVYTYSRFHLSVCHLICLSTLSTSHIVFLSAFSASRIVINASGFSDSTNVGHIHDKTLGTESGKKERGKISPN